MTAPAWSAVDDDTADLLTVLSDDGTLGVGEQWDVFVGCLRIVGARWMFHGMSAQGVIDPNHLRVALNGRIKPQRVGAFTHRALRAGLVEYTGRYVISTDTKGRNSGKPCRELRWIGGAA